MPYFIYRIGANRKLTPVESHPVYKDARQAARGLRAAQPEGDREIVKIIFARNEQEAERLLSIEREARPMGEELG